jgi:creatinine amidohydrolase
MADGASDRLGDEAPRASSTEHRLARMTRLEAVERAGGGAACLVPVGSLEQHGDHLPLSTDSLLAEHVCLEAARRTRTDVLVTPPLWTGLSPHHLRFGATVTVRSATFEALVRDTVESLATWCARVLVVNGHGGNRGPLVTLGVESAIESISYWELVRPARMSALFPFDLGSVGHAGEFETSAMLAAFPDRVGEPGFGNEPIPEQNAALLVPDLGESGVLGEPRAATADSGRAVLEDVVAALVQLLDGDGLHDPDDELGEPDEKEESE